MAQIAKEIPDLILLDVMMPQVSGLELLRMLLAEEETRGIPVIIMTAIVSPITRPIPSMTAATIPEDAAGRITRKIVCQCVAPSASDPSL